MKIEYRILWIEDDKSWIRVPKLRIEAKIKEYGFKPIIEPIYDCNLENLKYSDYDLILVARNKEDLEKVAKELSEKFHVKIEVSNCEVL